MFEQFKTGIANRTLYLLFYPSWKRFRRNFSRVKEIQEQYLLQLLKRNKNTRYGMDHGFSRVHSANEFQQFIPVTDYDQYEGYLRQIKLGIGNVLTSEKVTRLMWSSGTASASKTIPNTRALIREFDRCISVWLFDLYRNLQGLLNGKAFWIISPSTKHQVAENDTDNGFDDDSGYFSPAKRWLIKNVFAVPDVVARYCEGENYYFMLGFFLVSEKNLRLISVWNPSVFLILLEKIIRYKQEIVRTLETGQLVLPKPPDPLSAPILAGKVHKNKARAQELTLIFSGESDAGLQWKKVWPDLLLISAWDSVWARHQAEQLKKVFPGVAFQGKGLLATEACITFPVFNPDFSNSYLPAYFSHFFEFEQVETKHIKLLHELEANSQYEVIVTTGGGFYRYRLNDLVRCSGFLNGLPLLLFEGKTNLVSDVAGEKLHNNHVEKVLENVLRELEIESAFYFLAPQIEGEQVVYYLFMHTRSTYEPWILAEKIDAGLRKNFHYNHCRMLGQIGEPGILKLNDASESRFYSVMSESRNPSSLKQTILRKETFWKEKLAE